MALLLYPQFKKKEGNTAGLDFTADLESLNSAVDTASAPIEQKLADLQQAGLEQAGPHAAAQVTVTLHHQTSHQLSSKSLPHVSLSLFSYRWV